MEEILDTRLHKSLDKKWKWEVCVFPLIFSSFILSDNLFQRSKKDKCFHQSKPEHLWYLQRWHGSQQLQDMQVELNTEGFGSCIHICCAPYLLWAYYHVLYDPQWSFRKYWVSSQKTWGTSTFHGLRCTKPPFKWITRHPCMKLMLACYSNFYFRWLIV